MKLIGEEMRKFSYKSGIVCNLYVYFEIFGCEMI